mgnify:CR=1 FL=1
MSAIVLVAMAALFALGIGGVFLFLRFIDRLFPEKKKGPERRSGPFSFGLV